MRGPIYVNPTMVRLFLHGPVVVHNRPEVRSEVVDGALSISAGLGTLERVHERSFMLAHELAHVIMATDDELFAPGLGLPDFGSPITVEHVCREVPVFGVHFQLLRHAHALMTPRGLRTSQDFGMRVAPMITRFLLPPEERDSPTDRENRAAFEQAIVAATSNPELGPDFFLPERKRKLQLVAERGVKCTETSAAPPIR